MNHCRSRVLGIVRSAVAAAITAIAAGTHPAVAQSPEAFYRGKQVIFIIPVAAGGDYDLWGRMIIRHLGGHIPGKPNILPQNMPAAGK